MLRKLDKTNGVFNYFEFIFQRWIRVVVLLFGSVLMFYYLFPWTGEGPIWHLGEWFTNYPCKDGKRLLSTLFLYHNMFEEDVEMVSF